MSIRGCCHSMLRGCCGDDLLRVYSALVFCHIAYAWPAWCDLDVAGRKQLERMEKVVIRWCGPSLGYKDPITTRLDNICIKLMNKIKHNGSLHPLSVFFTRREHHHILRNPIIYVPRFYNLSLLRNSFLRFYNK